MRLAKGLLLGLTLFATNLSAQDSALVRFQGVTCPDSILPISVPSAIRDSLLGGEVDPPRLNVPLPEYGFRATASHDPPYWTTLAFVIDTTGYVDLCTVRVKRENEPRWTRRVLESLPEVRYRPAFVRKHPIRLSATQTFYFRSGPPPQ